MIVWRKLRGGGLRGVQGHHGDSVGALRESPEASAAAGEPCARRPVSSGRPWVRLGAFGGGGEGRGEGGVGEAGGGGGEQPGERGSRWRYGWWRWRWRRVGEGGESIALRSEEVGLAPPPPQAMTSDPGAGC
ncbi:hypothetical protein EYF80_059119 [Liparis tanakae]|uniref:Uncharacterized protein n=1 Tax=Liparis tanakae TaxID=230148 RepID=A0A4Z2EPL1_9TELE|nr:hypothetical protein EYF80_059119 [Liparis tanakae]